MCVARTIRVPREVGPAGARLANFARFDALQPSRHTRNCRTPASAQHPLDEHPAPTGLTRIPAIKRQPVIPTRGTRLRPRNPNTALSRQPGLDRDLEDEYDLHRLRIQPTTPGRCTRRGGHLVQRHPQASRPTSPLATLSSDSQPVAPPPDQRQTPWRSTTSISHDNPRQRE